MKNLLLAGMLLVLGGQIKAQTTISITIPQNVATMEWAQKYISTKIDSMINAVSPTKPAPVKCDRGPTILKFKAVTNTNSIVEFDGSGVYEMDYIVSGDQFYYKGHVSPESSVLNLSYPQAPAGKYLLTLIATSCTGGHSMSFTVK